MTYPSPPENAEIPFLLKGVMRNALLNRVKRKKSKNRYEQRVTALQEAGDTETEEDAIDNIPAPKTEEPEAQTLQKELQVIADTALKQLKPSEQAMIQSFFFQNKTAAAIAKELQCSRQYVEKMRNKALSHLRKLLKGYHIFNDGAFSCWFAASSYETALRKNSITREAHCNLRKAMQERAFRRFPHFAFFQ